MADDNPFRKGAQPDEVFETPLFRMERSGRFIKIETHRTPEQQAALVKSVVDNRHRLVERATECRAELKALIHRFSSLDIMAHQIAQDMLRDPNQYREMDSELRPHLIEYLALLELEDAEFEVRAIESPSPSDVARTRELLEEIFDAFKWQIMTEHITEENQGALNVQQELRFHALMYHVFVRSPAYHHHWVEILTDLFSSPRVAAWLEESHLRINDVLKCVDWLGGLILHRLRERLRTARAEEVRVREQITKLRRGEKPDFELPPIFQQLAQESGKNRAFKLEAILQQWALYAVGTTMTIGHKELSEYAEVSLEAAKAFLEAFSMLFGQLETADPFPRATHPLQQTPLIRYGEDSYFLAAPNLLAWSVKANFEARLKSETGAPWNNYQENRAKLVTRKALDYLGAVMPRSQQFEELYYEFEDQRFELDGLLLFDRYVLLLEAKAGGVSDASRRGGTKALEADLKDLVRDPSRQAERARKFILADDAPTFKTKDGDTVVIDKSIGHEVVTMALTLDNLAMFTSDMQEIKKLGLLAPDSISWTLYLPDLRIITELLPSSSEFWHYFRWRRSLIGLNNVFGTDEVNWLGIYLLQGPGEESLAPESYQLSFSSYTTEMDDYFLHQSGERSKPAKRPERQIPPRMRALIRDMEDTASPGFTAATELLLDLTIAERKKFEAALCKHEKSALPARAIDAKKVYIEIRDETDVPTAARTASDLATAMQKPAVVLVLKPRVVSVRSWNTANP
jgi:hypothetical protein